MGKTKKVFKTKLRKTKKIGKKNFLFLKKEKRK